MGKNILILEAAGVKRPIFISSTGIYDKVPGERHGAVLDPYQKSAAIIESSDLDYTVIRPERMNDEDEIDYEITQKGEPSKNPEAVVSRKSVADLVVKLATTPGQAIRGSLGVHKA